MRRASLRQVATFAMICVLMACLVPAACAQQRPVETALLPIGFDESRVPNVALDGFIYVAQDTPFPLDWVGAYPPVQRLTLCLHPAASTETAWLQAVFPLFSSAQSAYQTVPDSADVWKFSRQTSLFVACPNNSLADSLVRATTQDDFVSFRETYSAEWKLINQLPSSPPGRPVGAGFLKRTDSMKRWLSDIIQDEKSVTMFTDLLAKAKIETIAVGLYSQSDLSLVGKGALEDWGLSLLLVGDSSYPGFIMSLISPILSSMGMIEDTVSGQKVYGMSLNNVYLLLKNIGSRIYVSVAPNSAEAGRLLSSVLQAPEEKVVPSPKSPTNGSMLLSLTPRLQWNPSLGAASYGLQVSTDPFFNSTATNISGTSDTYHDVFPGELRLDTVYYWRVNAANETGVSDWSPSWSFRTPAGPDLTVTSVTFKPSATEVGAEIKVTFTVTNIGVSSSGPFMCRVSMATETWGTTYSLGNYPIDSLDSRATRTATVSTRTIPASISPGRYFVTVFVDSFSAVAESDEVNNIGSSNPNLILVSSAQSGPRLLLTYEGDGNILWANMSDVSRGIDTVTANIIVQNNTPRWYLVTTSTVGPGVGGAGVPSKFILFPGGQKSLGRLTFNAGESLTLVADGTFNSREVGFFFGLDFLHRVILGSPLPRTEEEAFWEFASTENPLTGLARAIYEKDPGDALNSLVDLVNNPNFAGLRTLIEARIGSLGPLTNYVWLATRFWHTTYFLVETLLYPHYEVDTLRAVTIMP